MLRNVNRREGKAENNSATQNVLSLHQQGYVHSFHFYDTSAARIDENRLADDAYILEAASH